MDVEGNGPSMQGLAQKLEELTERLGGLERENAELRGEVAALEGSAARGKELVARKPLRELGGEGATRPFSGSEEAVSRRAMLAKAGAAAVAAAGAGVLLSPREAKAAQLVGDGSPGVKGIGTRNPSIGVLGEIQSGLRGNGVVGSGKGAGLAGVFGSNFSVGGNGVEGIGDSLGVRGQGTTAGVYGYGPDGVQGVSYRNGASGVYGRHDADTVGPGVTGDGQGNWPGVWGRNDGGTGIKGEGKNGVVGESSTDDWAALYGNHKGTSGPGVVGDGKGPVYPGVFGRNASGYGGQFEGGKAQLKLNPKGSVGRPRSGSHQKGEIYLDSAASVFVCTRSGNPGTWRRVTTTATS